MKPTRTSLPESRLELLDPVRGEQRLTRRVDHDVRREVLEVGAGVDVGGAAIGEGVRPVAAVGVAAAVLDPQQLGAPLVELVVPHGGEVDVHQVARDRDRLLVEEAVRQRARADVVAREDASPAAARTRACRSFTTFARYAAPPAN